MNWPRGRFHFIQWLDLKEQALIVTSSSQKKVGSKKLKKNQFVSGLHGSADFRQVLK